MNKHIEQASSFVTQLDDGSAGISIIGFNIGRDKVGAPLEKHCQIDHIAMGKISRAIDRGRSQMLDGQKNDTV